MPEMPPDQEVPIAPSSKEAMDALISKRIDEAFTRNALASNATLDNLGSISEQKNINLDSMDRHERADAVKILNIVEQARLETERLLSGPQLDKAPLANRLQQRAGTVDTVYGGLISGRQEAVKILETMVSGFIDEAGPNQDASLLLKDIISQEQRFLANHCLNVAVVSLATAIELNKMMTRKLDDPGLQKDINLLRAIRLKTFTREELIKLGFAAFVHDIYYKKAFPHLKHTDVLNAIADRSNIERHASESYHLMRQFEMDYHVNKAVLQHHERIDGSGSPDGITDRLFSKYTAILAFADRYITLTQPNPFSPLFHPTVALKRIMTTEKAGFDLDAMVAFAHAGTMVPIGSWVLLEDGTIGYSSRREEGQNLPIIHPVMRSSGEPIEMPSDVDPRYDGSRIRQLLTAGDLMAINPKYASLYLV